MSKLTNALNQIWYVNNGETINIGFTKSFLDTLDECWHILPAVKGPVKEKAPLMVVETNDRLVSILSPISGNFLDFATKASNFPDKLTETDIVMSLSTAKKVEKTAVSRSTADFGLDDRLTEALHIMRGGVPGATVNTGPRRPTWTATAIPNPPIPPATFWDLEAGDANGSF